MKKNPKKNPKKYYCKKCDFLTSNKKDFNRHLLTRKHNLDNKDNKRIIQKNPNYNCYECTVCGKKYKYASGLSKHKKKCMQAMYTNLYTVQKGFTVYSFYEIRGLSCKNKNTNKRN